MFGKVFHILKAASDLLMPRSCIVCGRTLLAREEHLCIWCAHDLPLTYFWLQSRNAMGDKFNALVQRRLERTLEDGESLPPIPYIPAVALFFYRSKTGYRKITQRLKYHGDISAGRHFARQLSHHLAACPATMDADLVVPVPLHWTRRWSRGYNQAEVIAAELASALGCTMVPDLLRRNRRTRTQTRMGMGEKGDNVRGAFSVSRRHQGDGKGMKVILVDDVFTTGATLFECWKALQEWDPQIRICIATLGYVG